MIPLFAIIRISTKKDSSRGKRRRHDAPPPQHAKTARAGDPVERLGLWVPLFLIWLLLLPLVLVLLPLAMLALLVLRVNPFRALAAFWQTLAGLTGTHVEVNAPDALVYVRIF
jgi:hypothetical protein